MRALRDSREMRLGIKNLPTAPTLTRLVSAPRSPQSRLSPGVFNKMLMVRDKRGPVG